MGQEDDLRALIEVLSQRVALLEQICLPALQSNAAKNSMASTGLVFRGVVNSVATDHGIDAARIMDMSTRPQDVCRARWAIWPPHMACRCITWP